MKVLMIGPYPTAPDRIDGGAAAALMYLSSEIAKDPSVELLGVRLGETLSSTASRGRFDWPILDLPLGRLGLARRYGQELVAINQIVSNFRPDIVHGQGIDVAGYLSVRSHLSAVVTVHGIPEEESKFRQTLTSRLRERLACSLISDVTLREARNIISINPYVKNYYSDRLNGTVFEIANAVPPGYFSIERRPEAGRILFAGRLIPRKGVLDLVYALARIRQGNKKLILAGSSSDLGYRRVIDEEVHRLDLSHCIEFLGHCSEARIMSEFSRAEALALPSYQETAPMVIQQAMAAGLPIVASKICGIPFQVDDGLAGILYEPGDIAGLTGGLERILANRDLSNQLGLAGRMKAARLYHGREVARATISAYRQIIELETPAGANL